MALELSHNYAAASARYVRVYRDEDAAQRRDALYRAVGCLHRMGDQATIAELLGDLTPGDWRGYQELGLIAGLAFSGTGDPVRSISWLLIEPDIETPESSARLLLTRLIDKGAEFRNAADVRRFLLESIETIFVDSLLCRKVIRWVARSGHAGQLAAPELIQSSKGKSLSYASMFFRESGAKGTARQLGKMALVLQPDDPGSMQAILPDETEGNVESLHSPVRWAKAITIVPDSKDFMVNDAVIALKIADLESLTTTYLARAADRFKASPKLLYNIGAHFNEKALAEQAEPVLRRAVLLEPGYAKAWSSYTISMCTMLKPERGIVSSLRALTSDPKVQSGYTNLAMAYRGVGELDLAVSAGKRQLEVSPNDAVARMGVAFNSLAIGAIEEGFTFYRHRWAQKGFPSKKRPFPQTEWTLQKIPRANKVLIYMEQGMGDELMFSWFLYYAEELAPGQVVVECDSRLIPVFERTFPTIEFWPMTGPCQRRLLADDIQYKVPIGHLPSMFTARLRQLIKDRWTLGLDRLRSGNGWILPSPEGVTRWRDELAAIAGDQRICIGVAWRSANMARARVSQYLTAEEITQSLPDNSVAVILQYVYEDEEIDIIRREASRRGIDVVIFDDLDLKNDLSDVVDLCAAVDAIVTPLTSTAFMGGVVGTPTWVFRTSPTDSIWQQLGAPFIPWIPDIRLFFRDATESWGAPVVTVRDDLSASIDWVLERRRSQAQSTGADNQ